MEDDLKCSLCFEDYQTFGDHEPRMIPTCGHTFCLACLNGLPQRLCPLDRQEIKCGTESMPKNHFIVALLDKPKCLSTPKSSTPKTITELQELKKDIEKQIEEEETRLKHLEIEKLSTEQKQLIEQVAKREETIANLQKEVEHAKKLNAIDNERLRIIKQNLDLLEQKDNKKRTYDAANNTTGHNSSNSSGIFGYNNTPPPVAVPSTSSALNTNFVTNLYVPPPMNQNQYYQPTQFTNQLPQPHFHPGTFYYSH